MANILVLDDDVMFLDLVEKLLTEEGYRVKTATNGRDGLDLLAQASFDLLITDIFMPEKDGISVLEELKQLESGHLKIICMSTGAGAASTEAALTSMGAEAVLTKPLDMELFLSEVQRIVSAMERHAAPLPPSDTEVSLESPSLSSYGGAEAKRQLARQVGRLMQAQNLTLDQAGEMMNISPDELSSMFNGHGEALSFDRVLEALPLLGWDVEIVAKPVAPGTVAAVHVVTGR